MTAAVARPPLFGHLVASRPDREQNSVAATAASLAIHAVGIAAVMALTARVSTITITQEPTPVIVNPTIPEPVAPAPVKPILDGGASSGNPMVPAPFSFTVPDVVPVTIPLPGGTAVYEPPDFVRGSRASSGGTGSAETTDQPGAFTPMTVVPRLLNRDEVLRLLQRVYPPVLLQAGIGGTAIVWIKLDEEGTVTETRIKQSSGQPGLDKAALEVAAKAKFSPAWNRDQKVRVWVELPVVFNARNP
jgi:TonB family protein